MIFSQPELDEKTKKRTMGGHNNQNSITLDVRQDVFYSFREQSERLASIYSALTITTNPSPYGLFVSRKRLTKPGGSRGIVRTGCKISSPNEGLLMT